MSAFQPISRKTADDGSTVNVLRDAHHGWFIGKDGESEYSPRPLGSFKSEEAARAWADHEFPGGSWQPV